MITHKAIKGTAFSLLAALICFAPGIIGSAWLQQTVPPGSIGSDPVFNISLRDNVILLSGATRSQDHERILAETAAALFADRTIDTDFYPFGVTPDYWVDLSVDALRAVADARFANIVVGEDSLTLGAVFPGTGWEDARQVLEKRLPAALATNFDILLVDDRTSSRDSCRDSLAQFSAGPINFEESTDRLRSSAFPRLDRVIAIAEACAHTGITITGHTDSSGDENWNEVLSIKRANAVRNYLVSGGVDAGRVSATGAGSSEPVANNDTRYGRSENRRIDIEFVESD